MFEKETIPEELISELKTYYKEVDLSTFNGPLNENLQTQKIRYRKKVNDNQDMTYIIRGINDGNSLKLYSILEAGIVLRK